ncbi:MAG: hypothetical protein AAF916_02845 [Planctomycetota bacterium]
MSVGFRAAAVFDAYADRGQGVMHPLDLAAAYLRRCGGAVLAWYAIAMAPLLVAGWFWIDAASAEDRGAVRGAGLFVVAAMVWRWAWLVPVQATVMRDTGMPVRYTAGRIGAAVLSRLASHILIVWGGLVIFPGFFGFYVGSFVTVALLSAERDTAIGAGVQRTLGLTWTNLGGLLRHTWASLALLLIWALTLLLTVNLSVTLVLPSLMGIDTTDLRLAMTGPAWWLGMGMLGWVVFDIYWQVSAVFTVRQLEAQRSGGDLFARLDALRAQAEREESA